MWAMVLRRLAAGSLLRLRRRSRRRAGGVGQPASGYCAGVAAAKPIAATTFPHGGSEAGSKPVK